MVKKRRLGSSTHSTPSKIRYESRGDDLMVARDRLKGALEGLVHSEDESSSSLDEVIVTPTKMGSIKRDLKSQIIRRRKRKAPVEEEVAFHNEFVMKLFDRSVNFARFQEDTPLYPICRTWMANVPRVMSSRHTPEHSENMELKHDDRRLPANDIDDSNDVHSLPPPSSPMWVSRIPSISKPELQGVNLDYDLDNLPSADELLKGHLERWKQTRQKWNEVAQINDMRYQNSVKVLTNMYKRYQNTLT